MQLRDYQDDISTKACQLLHDYKIAYLSMQVRTGKTITALETCRKYKAKNVTFVTKKKAIPSIEKDYRMNYSQDFMLYLINYENLHHLGKTNSDVFILDEAHCLGGFPQMPARASQLKEICTGAAIIYLSGTPSPESYSQLFHQFHISSYSPFPVPSFYKWVWNGFVTPQTKYLYNREIKNYSNANKKKIDEYCGHLFISFTQEEAGFTELVSETIHTVRMNPVTYNMSKKLQKDRILTTVRDNKAETIEADTEVKLMNKLHQIYSGTVIIDDSMDREFSVFDRSKIHYIQDKFFGQKIAIYYKFKAELQMLIDCYNLTEHELTTNAEHFNKTGNNVIYVSQFASGREGVNLSSADCLICLNIDFSAVTYFQVRARIQSKERSKEAQVHWIFAEDGIEHKIYEVVKNKKNYTLSYFKKQYK